MSKPLLQILSYKIIRVEPFVNYSHFGVESGLTFLYILVQSKISRFFFSSVWCASDQCIIRVFALKKNRRETETTQIELPFEKHFEEIKSNFVIMT